MDNQLLADILNYNNFNLCIDDGEVLLLLELIYEQDIPFSLCQFELSWGLRIQ